MKTETLKGTMENAYGQPLPTIIAYKGEFESFTSLDEIPANEKPGDEDILAFVNNKRKANARQKFMNEALQAAGIQKPTLEDNPDLQVSTMVKALVASGKYDKDAAEKIARQTLGL